MINKRSGDPNRTDPWLRRERALSDKDERLKRDRTNRWLADEHHAIGSAEMFHVSNV